MAWIRKHVGPRGTRYRVHYRDRRGVEHTETFSRRHDAEVFKREREHDADTGRHRDVKAGRELFADYYARSTPPAATSTRVLYRTAADRYVLPTFGDLQLAEIGRGDVKAWVAGLEARGVGPPTIQLAHRVLRRTLAQAVDDEILEANAAARVSTPKVRRKQPAALGADELERLADAIDPRYRALVLLCGYGGLRFGEAAGLRRRSVDVLGRKVTVTEALAEVRGQLIPSDTKTGRPRPVAIPASVAKELAAHMKATMRPIPADRSGTDYVFTDPMGGPIRRTNFRRRFWEPAVKAAKLDPAPTPHDLRHSAAALAISKGAHPKAIQERLGHSSIRVTFDVYGHLFKGLDEKIARDLDGVRPAAKRKARAERLRNDSPAEVVELATRRR